LRLVREHLLIGELIDIVKPDEFEAGLHATDTAVVPGKPQAAAGMRRVKCWDSSCRRAVLRPCQS
jgi:hypothetical protein